LSTPLTVTLVVMGRYVPSLNFLRILLGDQPEISRSSLYYQRLLASDQNEARQVLEQYLKERPLEDLYGEVLIPALSMVEQDRHRNELDEETESFIMQSTRELIEEFDDVGDGEAISPNTQSLKVLCIPARDEADEIIALLLSQLLVRNGLQAHNLAVAAMSEIVSAVADANPDMVCISALPPFAIDHARALYQKLRSKMPALEIVICLWHYEGDMEKAARRLKVTDPRTVQTALTEVLEYVTEKTTQSSIEPASVAPVPALRVVSKSS